MLFKFSSTSYSVVFHNPLLNNLFSHCKTNTFELDRSIQPPGGHQHRVQIRDSYNIGILAGRTAHMVFKHRLFQAWISQVLHKKQVSANVGYSQPSFLGSAPTLTFGLPQGFVIYLFICLFIQQPVWIFKVKEQWKYQRSWLYSNFCYLKHLIKWLWIVSLNRSNFKKNLFNTWTLCES